MGKSLYTTLRELIENALDACESVNTLPSIAIQVHEMTQSQFNLMRGLSSSPVKTTMPENDKTNSSSSVTKGGNSSKKTSKTQEKKKKVRQADAYFKIIVRDNGCGMAHDAIPNLLGRVLSGSKYGVRQTRGKFGLGAKMALIWSKKSTGVPIQVTTSHMKKPPQPGSHVSHCVLDIDIYKNCPRVMKHTKRPNNNDAWIGTEFQLVIAGNWKAYKARIVQYLQQLAIITPYAQLQFDYYNQADSKRNMKLRFDRRSEQMPPPAKEVKHHPSSVNNLVIQQLLDQSKPSMTLIQFLSKQLSCVSTAVAQRLVVQDLRYKASLQVSDMTDLHVTRLVQTLRSADYIKSPDGSCLAPLGEYNLSLGIHKVLKPQWVATARDRACAHEGHPFIVEAAVSLGGGNNNNNNSNGQNNVFCKEGITVFRFANRIPLLFEGGADVATRVAQSKIKWSLYKMDYKRDRIGVFVSIVSTKIPFKGTGKEYIGDDIVEIQTSVKRALQSCCQQLRTHLTKQNALRDLRERRSKLVKHVPDVGRALFGLLQGMQERQQEQENEEESDDDDDDHRRKRRRMDPTIVAMKQNILRKVQRGEITKDSIQKSLISSIEQQVAVDRDASTTAEGKKSAAKQKKLPPLFLVPQPEYDENSKVLHHPLFLFRPLISQVDTQTNSDESIDSTEKDDDDENDDDEEESSL